MTYTFSVSTKAEELVDITGFVQSAIRETGVKSGTALIFCPHTTAAITINENADPDVKADLLKGLAYISPDRPVYMHAEGNSPAHIKASLVGSSVSVIIENGALLLGTWQGIYFCEFDGPRKRYFHVKIQKD
ncbi:YjbQ family protein [Treponema phagedenis]|uniref:YjbQ family protein n=1 Tax=Treponema phagedenis TaxID=162 RepID=A0A0B7GXD6_TREPH|nr:secondary thiamine-phosphate synthase enzyme YjbQ [Treponema phagedenis]NVP23698.1 YjbQ family protein [Treponema phagedenis]QEJ94477.1 YjbQ family protein [Treponema phagedenis]QEJ97544.1 YjbQ family protein [Treponema phagedenis]QEK01641.1 YjbQ family protein [Treponema phagedenis]QEK03111.1 YjbQ family protein [Treponema phagedenis]